MTAGPPGRSAGPPQSTGSLADRQGGANAATADPRNGKNQAGLTHPADSKDPTHIHATKDGTHPSKRGGNPHYTNGKKQRLNPNKVYGQPKKKGRPDNVIDIKNIGVELVPDRDSALQWVSAGAALFMNLATWEVEYANLEDVLRESGWNVIRTVREESYPIDPEGTEAERNICEVLLTGQPVCNMTVIGHKTLGRAFSPTLASFDRYVGEIVRNGASVLCGSGREVQPFDIEGQAVIPLLASPTQSVKVLRQSTSTSTGLRIHKLRPQEVSNFLKQMDTQQLVAIDLLPGSLLTWHPKHLLGALTVK